MWRVTECNSVKNVKQNIIRHQWLQLIAQDYLENDSKSQTLRFIPDKSSKIRLAGAYFSCQSPGSGSLDLNNLQSLHFYSCPLSNKVLTLEELNPLIKLVTITLLRNECSRNGGGCILLLRKGRHREVTIHEAPLQVKTGSYSSHFPTGPLINTK